MKYIFQNRLPVIIMIVIFIVKVFQFTKVIYSKVAASVHDSHYSIYLFLHLNGKFSLNFLEVKVGFRLYKSI